MELKQNAYYVGSRSFESKAGKKFNLVTLADVDGAGKGTVSDFFIDEMPKLCENAVFGDLFECVLDLENLNSKPKLVALNKLIKPSAFFNKGV